MNFPLSHRRFSRSRFRCGFSLVDLICVVALVAILVALTLPVVSQNREEARNRRCQYRLGQIGLGSQVYEAIYGRLPCSLGASGAVSSDDYNSSSSEHFYLYLANSSPLMLIKSVTEPLDIDPLLLDFDTYRLPQQFGTMYGYETLAKTNQPEFRCPADFDPTPTAITTYGLQPTYLTHPQFEDYVSVLEDSSPGAADYGYTNYGGVLGASTGGHQRAPSEYWRFRGMITSRESVNSKEVAKADGLSNSLMFGEVLGNDFERNGVPTRMRLTWVGQTVLRGRGPTRWMTGGEFDDYPMLGRQGHSVWYGFGSAHRNGVNFVKGDASVQLISRNIDWETYYQLCGSFDTQEP